ncbi:prolactin receptor b [Xyrichtys novacula]|uniref:Prolactin receptor n=1 Tax=Xyrichtys novacula TaxID=13765 RepID=A0AAV1G779_XYRNO|nr:prolactin receptor b [Xyrichtys novacula]
MQSLFWMMRGLELALLLLLCAALQSNSMSPPGKPVLLSCRSPEKETFTCWWEPGSDGGLPTTHRLYYERERLKGTHECPDYQSAGKNSCFFDKNHTSIWVDYYLTVVASNALGNATSDLLKLDVMEIVKPDPPENVALQVEDREDSPLLHVSWEHPHNTDIKSGWVTIKYALRVKQGNSNKWKEYTSGTQTHFRLYSVSPGVEYTVQVRCMLDHGFWSEWSNTSSMGIPNYLQTERPFWVLMPTLFVILCTVVMFILVLKRKNLKQYVLPPVPRPKISGVDFQLLKSAPTEDTINALNQNFPCMVAWKDQMEDYLIVTENDNRFQPDFFSSQKRKNSLLFPSGLYLHSEIQESEPRLNDQENVGKRSLSYVPAQEHQNPSLNFVFTEAPDQTHSKHDASVKPFPNTGYVDIQRCGGNTQEVDEEQLQYSRVKEVDSALILEKENITLSRSGYTDIQRQEENTSEGYSRVKEVGGDSVVILQQKKNLSPDSAYQEERDYYMDYKPRSPHVTGFNRTGLCTEMNDSGYVDNVLNHF